VSEMLLQSHEGCIEPLPALPEAWGTGRFDGLVARGNFEVSAVWEAGGLRELSIHSRSGKACRVKYPGLAAATVVAEDGQTIESTANGSDEIAFPTRKGMTYQILLKSE
jgi:alpha-L-fucosidase 2